MQLPEFLLFDLDNTILDFHRAEREAVSKTLSHIGIEPSPDKLKRYSELNNEQWKLLEQGKVTREELKVRRYANLFREFDIDYPVKEAAYYYEERLGEGSYFLEGAQEVLTALSRATNPDGRKKHRLFVVSNGTLPVQRSRIAKAGLAAYFEKFFISEEIGFNKPDKEFFDVVFSEIGGFRPEAATVIGDSLSSDIQGGINAGISTIWLNLSKEANCTGIRPDVEIHSLRELTD